MVVTRSDPRALLQGASPAVIWHEIECGGYRADLALWRELAEDARNQDRGAAILDIGAGTGRVALDLARAGHSVTALDSASELLDALYERAGKSPVETVHADARSFELERHDYALCLVPMQTIQLLGGASGRSRAARPRPRAPAARRPARLRDRHRA